MSKEAIRIVLVSFLVMMLSSCVKDRFSPENELFTYLSASLRGQKEHSINKDNEAFEDRVGSVAMLVFKSGGTVREAFYYNNTPNTVSHIPATKVPVGELDIFVLANVLESEVEGLKYRSKLMDYLGTMKNAENYVEGATESNPFPMARVYLRQYIGEGGTQANPKKWSPTPIVDKPLFPISHYGVESAPNGFVGLVRPFAKVSISLQGEGAGDVESITYYNIRNSYSLMEKAPKGAKTGEIYNKMVTTKPDVKEYKIYVPEYLFEEGTTWDNENKSQNKVFYFELKTKAGRVLTVPVASNVPSGDYRKQVINPVSGTIPNFDVIRNNHYQYTITVSKDAKKIEVEAKVMPWTKLTSIYNVAKPKCSLIITQDSGEAQIVGDKTVEIKQQGKIKCTLQLSSPEGAIWRASLTNGLDFKISGTTLGIADSDLTKKYEFFIQPSKAFTGTPRFTELYITVDGLEVQVVPKFIEQNKPAGKGWRTVIKQVE